MESLCLPKINTKMPTRTKTVGMSRIVSDSEIHLHHCVCESRGFKIGRSNHQRCSVKKGVLENFEKLTEKHLCPSPTRVFYCLFTKFLRTFLYRTLPRDCFWWRGLMIKKFNFLSPIFLNLQLYNVTAEWWLLFWCNEEHLLIKKIWLNFK